MYALNDLYFADCMKAMHSFPDKYFGLAVVDPPYGINAEGGTGKYGRQKFEHDKGVKAWDSTIPTAEYFDELFRISENQVIFGGNYFPLRPTRGYIVWDKGAGFRGRDFAECEFAWTSFNRNARIFSYDPLAHRDYIDKIHPTQKPVRLYEWVLMNYAKEGQRIIDTHAGSGSSLIACYNLHFDHIGFEIDPDYYSAAKRRIKAEQAQLRFDIVSPMVEQTKHEQYSIITEVKQ
jgi:site-specific DNA-methyltransferase (adenine-specific)